MRRPGFLVAALLVGSSVGACAVLSGLDNLQEVGDDGGGVDAAEPDGRQPPPGDGAPACQPACTGSTPLCDPTSGRCVECLADGDCGPGTICESNLCRPGCAADHTECGPDAGQCNLEAGTCAECLIDSDCKSPADPRCNPANNQCVPCLPQNDNCTGGTFCHEDPGGGFACVRGCKVATDCLVDGGALNADGGAGGDTTCCTNICVDTSKDTYNCNGCGNTCKGTTPACCGATCFDESSDPRNCGGCGNACSASHMATVTCTVGVCNGTCAQNYADCDGNKLTDGCETETDDNPLDCGGCGVACSNNNMQTVSCGSGLCNGTCAAGFADCTGTKQSNGCQTNLANDPNHCGGCGNVCSSNHMTTVACGGGACDGACAANFADCNANKLFDGCETETDNNLQDCGGCGLACSSNNVVAGTLACSGGACSGQCNGQFANCDGTLQANGCNVNIDTDPSHCGGCGTSCSAVNVATPGCTAGACNPTCAAGFTNCSGTFQQNGCNVNTTNDPANCGGCGATCNGTNDTPQCTGSTCTSPCNGGFANCDGTLATNGCNVNTTSDPSNCGGCGAACNGTNDTPQCTGSACTSPCNGGFANCDGTLATNGCNVDTTSDPNNCNGCGTVCPSGICTGGVCQ